MTVAAVVCVVAVALAVGLLFWLRHTVKSIESGPSSASSRAFAESLLTRRSDGADGKWIGQEFARLARLVPWLTASGHSVFDVCSAAGSSGSLFGGGSVRYEIQCNRTDGRYYTYGGSSAARVHQLERALSRMGWGTFTPVPATEDSSALPVVAADPSAGMPPTGKSALQFSWSRRGSQLDLERDIGAVPPLVAPQRNTYIEVLRPTLKAILSHLSAARRHVLIIALTVTYADRTAPT
jgi:hypothetical protein